MQASKDYKPNQSRGILIVGQTGMGKTTTALQIATPTAYISDMDNNLSGAHRFLKGSVNFMYDTPKDWADLTNQLKLASRESNVNTLILDSFSRLTDLMQDEILRQQGRKTMQLQDWGVFLKMMKTLIAEMRSTSKLFIGIAHIKPEKDEVSGVIKYFPALPGQIQHQIGALFSDVLLCEVEERSGKYTFQIRTMPNTFHALKNSLGLPPVTDAETVRKAIQSSQ